MYRSDKNKGLPTTFQLQNGRFGLLGGPLKCQDNMRMLVAFGNWFRYGYMDFCVNLTWLLQKSTNFILTFKIVTLGQFMRAAEKYCQFIQIKKANVSNHPDDRKRVDISIEYTNSLEPDSKYQYTEILN
jgi:hypothetical protein